MSDVLVGPNIADDIKTLPQTIRRHPITAVPAIVLALGLILIAVYDSLGGGMSTLARYYLQFFFVPPSILTFLIAGLVAPRSGYLIGLLYGLLAGTVWFAAFALPRSTDVGVPLILSTAFVLVLYGVLYGVVVAVIGRFVRRLIDLRRGPIG